MSSILIKSGSIVNEGKIFRADILISDGRIAGISNPNASIEDVPQNATIIDASDCHVLPGVIDDQVHFREPGLTHKEDVYSGSKAAVAGGVTSYMEMPNTIPNVFTHELLEEKYSRAAACSLANYSFYLGASNENLDEILSVDPNKVCGIKIFMGSSTGNMLVDNQESLKNIFSQSKMLIATHCEDEETIQTNLKQYQNKYGTNIPFDCHPLIRSEEACYRSSSLAVELAAKHGARLHVLHISTEKELALFNNSTPLKDKKITAEACIHHLWFDDSAYQTKGSHIKWNPAIKTTRDRDCILQAVKDNTIDVIATDHAPHTLEEKSNPYLHAPSGGPLIQHSLVAMLELCHEGKITLEKLCDKMCHAPADCFHIKERGYIKEGYWADLVIVNTQEPWTVNQSNLHYKCGWSPFEGQQFHGKVKYTFVNGNLVYQNDKENNEPGFFNEAIKGQRLAFNP